MRQTIMISMSLICQPKILIFDKDTTALDFILKKRNFNFNERITTQKSNIYFIYYLLFRFISEIEDDIIVMY